VERNGVSDVDSVESEVERSEDRMSDRRGLKTGKEGLRFGLSGDRFEGDDEHDRDRDDDALLPQNNSMRDDSHFQRYYDRNRQKSQFRNDKNEAFNYAQSPSRSRENEFKIYHFQEKSPDIDLNKFSSPFIDSGSKKRMRSDRKNRVVNGDVVLSDKMDRIKSSSIQHQYADNVYKDKNEKKEIHHQYQKLNNNNSINSNNNNNNNNLHYNNNNNNNNDDNNNNNNNNNNDDNKDNDNSNNNKNYKKISFNQINKSLTTQIIEIKINQIFPDLQEHLIKRYSYLHNTHATQTDPIENYFPLSQRNTEIASNLGLKNTVGGADFHATNPPSFVAVKVIRFDNQKLGLIFSKVNFINNYYFISNFVFCFDSKITLT
jgi:hypothetical protein